MVGIDLSQLQTEGRNPRSADIDRVSTHRLCEIINAEDSICADAVRKCIPVIADAIDVLSTRVRNGGRVIYVGAGTSGRLGVLDASEIPPTYSAPASQFVGLIAGGDAAIRNAQEGAEDSLDGAERDMKIQNLDPRYDSLIGIAASGRTPYVLGCLKFAKALGCATVGIACCEPSKMSDAGTVDYMISPVTGPEVVTGSTRMKAGTATKLVLNMLSTGIMIKLGKTYGNLMVDMKSSNAKLIARSRRMVRSACGSAAPQDDEAIDTLLKDCSGSVKLAIATLLLKLPVTETRERLDKAGGSLEVVIREQTSARERVPEPSAKSDLCLCVDGGGTKCQAVIISPDGKTFWGEGGPCNVTDVGLQQGVLVLKQAVSSAFEVLKRDHSSHSKWQLDFTMFKSVWIGLAGYGRPQNVEIINKELSAVFALSPGRDFLITNDIDLHGALLHGQPEGSSAIALVAGTGSVAMSYEKRHGHVVCTARSGGWGYMVGDAGSAFAIGRDGLRVALRELDSISEEGQISLISRKVLAHLGMKQAEGLSTSNALGAALLHGGDTTNRGSAKARVASLAPVILAEYDASDIARDIVNHGAAALTDEVRTLLTRRGIDAGKSTLIVGGGLLVKSDLYREKVLQRLAEQGIIFKSAAVVEAPASDGAQALLAMNRDKGLSNQFKAKL